MRLKITLSKEWSIGSGMSNEQALEFSRGIQDNEFDVMVSLSALELTILLLISAAATET